MIQSGDVLHNPVTGETLHIVRSAAETGSEYVLIEVRVEPGGFVAATHVHPFQDETFEVLEGEIGSRRVARRSSPARARRSSSSPGRRTASGMPATHQPASGARCAPPSISSSSWRRCTRLPPTARRTARACRTRFRLAVIAKHHFDDVRLPFPPAWIQRVGLTLGAPVGRLLGYDAGYDGTAPQEAALAL